VETDQKGCYLHHSLPERQACRTIYAAFQAQSQNADVKTICCRNASPNFGEWTEALIC